MFDASSVGLFYECISLLKIEKKIFISHKKIGLIFYSLQILIFLLQNRTDFFYIQTKNQFFPLVLKIDLIFLNQKTLFYLIKQDLIFFFFTKNYFFLPIPKQIWFFLNQINFLLQDRFEFFSKEEDTLINRLMWLSLVKVFHVYNISFISCIKGVHWSWKFRRPNSIWVEWVPNTFPFCNPASKFSVFG